MHDCLKKLLIGLVLSLVTVSFAQSYTVSVVPQFPRLVLFEDWQPLLDYLEEETGLSFDLKIHDTIPKFEEAFLEGMPDFAFMNPYHAVMAHEVQGYQPMISDASRKLKGILVVRQDSSFESVQDMNGATLVFPSPNAFGASLYMRALLVEQENIAFEVKYVGTHSNSYRHTLLGQAAAGGGVWNTFNKEPEDFRSQLRVLYETPGVTPHPLAVHPRVSDADRDRVMNAILALRESDEGIALLKAVQLSDPMQVDFEQHYSVLADLNLTDFVVAD